MRSRNSVSLALPVFFFCSASIWLHVVFSSYSDNSIVGAELFTVCVLLYSTLVWIICYVSCIHLKSFRSPTCTFSSASVKAFIIFSTTWINHIRSGEIKLRLFQYMVTHPPYKITMWGVQAERGRLTANFGFWHASLKCLFSSSDFFQYFCLWSR